MASAVAEHMKQTTTVFAHRGLSSIAPENTLSAFRLMANHGVTWCETDVDVMADGTLLVMHDATFDRTTNASGRYDDVEGAALDTIDAGSWFSPHYAGEPLPTLPQLIDLLNELKLNCNIEIKPNEVSAARTDMAINGVIEQIRRLDPDRQVIVSSFSPLVLERVKDRAPDIAVGYLVSNATFSPDWRAVMQMIDADFIHPESRGLTRDTVQDIRAAGYGVNVWTVNTPARANELFNWGATGIFTDYAHKLIHLQH